MTLKVIGEVGSEPLGQVEQGVPIRLVPAGEDGGQHAAALGLQPGNDPLPVLGGCHQGGPPIDRIGEPEHPAANLDGMEMTADGRRVETQVTGQIGDPDRAFGHHPTHDQKAGSLAVDAGPGSHVLMETLQGAVPKKTCHRLLEALQSLIGCGGHPGSIMVVFTNQIQGPLRANRTHRGHIRTRPTQSWRRNSRPARFGDKEPIGSELAHADRAPVDPDRQRPVRVTLHQLHQGVGAEAAVI